MSPRCEPGPVLQLTTAVKQQALAEGVDLVGVAAAGPGPWGEGLATWLAAGWHGEMQYLADTAAQRCDPGLVLPGCRSLVVVALSYATSRTAATGQGRVQVSRYAWGRDYHKLLKRRLLRLGRWLAREAPGVAWRAAVDTVPVAERSWAAQAGLGWIGKSGMLLHHRLGSQLFLGVLLTDLELAPDSPVAERCGTCRACIDACPGNALHGSRPGLVDARRCLSYLTLEHRGPIPPAMAPRLGAWLAGCDCCQMVCPWNRAVPTDLHAELQPVLSRCAPLLTDLEQMGEEELRAWRAGSALGRLSHSQLRRNLTVVRANLNRRPVG